jgi:hypothetical protein
MKIIDKKFTICYDNILVTNDLRKNNRGRLEGIRLLGTFRKKREGEIEMDLEKIRYEYVGWIHLAQDKVQ